MIQTAFKNLHMLKNATLLIKQSHFDGFFHFPQQFLGLAGKFFVYIQNNITNFLVGLEVLGKNIDLMLGELGIYG